MTIIENCVKNSVLYENNKSIKMIKSTWKYNNNSNSTQ